MNSKILFPEKFSTHYAAKFKNDNCPLRKQVEYSFEECIKYPECIKDPLGDKKAEIETGILQKYGNRLLVLASNECAIHCRFCFRRNLMHKKNNDLPSGLFKILRKDKSIKEVILSGGDPLMLSDCAIKALLDVIPKKMNIRIHSRIPIAMPKRFTSNLFALFEQFGMRMVFVAHVNHANELDKESKKIFERLNLCKVVLLNQSVLLRGINDNAKILAELSEKLFSQRVLPYYLHNLDKAQGAGHFGLEISEAKAIFEELKELLPGYLVPRLVMEVKGGKSKKWI